MNGSLSPLPAPARPDDPVRDAFRPSDLSGYPFKKRLAIHGATALLISIIRTLGLTTRLEFEGGEHREAAERAGGAPIAAFWHDSIALATYAFRRRNIVVMTSRSFDGEYIARAIQWFGYGATRGSSTRGGIGALIEMIRLMRLGYGAAFTIDGPKGPRHVAKAGPILLAKKTGRPIVPLAITPARCWTLRSWDRLIFPKPFNRALVAFAPPITVAPDADDAEVEAKRCELQASLDALERRGREWRAARIARSWWPGWSRSRAAGVGRK